VVSLVRTEARVLSGAAAGSSRRVIGGTTDGLNNLVAVPRVLLKTWAAAVAGGGYHAQGIAGAAVELF